MVNFESIKALAILPEIPSFIFFIFWRLRAIHYIFLCINWMNQILKLVQH